MRRAVARSQASAWSRHLVSWARADLLRGAGTRAGARWPASLGALPRLHGHVVPRLLRFSCRRSDAVFCLNRPRPTTWPRTAGRPPSGFTALPTVSRRNASWSAHIRPGCGGCCSWGSGCRPRAFAISSRRSPRSPAGPMWSWRASARARRKRPCWATFPRACGDGSGCGRAWTATRSYAELGRADLFVFPSLSEGFSNALLEAMAASLPIVATPAGAAGDLLRDGVNAAVVPPAIRRRWPAGSKRCSETGRGARAGAGARTRPRATTRCAA